MGKWVSAALAAGALFAAVPSWGQESATAQDNLDCAVVTAIAGGQPTDEKAKNGIAMLLSYFAGLYEGQTGTNIDDVLPTRLVKMTIAEITKASATCQARGTAFSQRLITLGEKMSKQGG